jgi:hypothetical protein
MIGCCGGTKLKLEKDLVEDFFAQKWRQSCDERRVPGIGVIMQKDHDNNWMLLFVVKTVNFCTTECRNRFGVQQVCSVACTKTVEENKEQEELDRRRFIVASIEYWLSRLISSSFEAPVQRAP